MPVTFGSVGDIIAVALLVKDLVEALDRCRGSKAEYRQLIQELRLLEDVLRNVDHLCNTSGTSGASFETVALHQTALKITDSCRNLIQAFTGRLAKYDKALGDNTQKKNVFKSAVAKIRWQVGEKEDVVRFRAEVAAQTTSLSLLLGATTWGVGKDTQQYLKNLEGNVSQQFNVQTNMLSDITTELVEAKTVLQRAGSISGMLLGKLSRVGDLCTQIKTTVTKILFVNIAIYKAVLALQNLLPSHLERSLINEPFVLEDAIGRMSPVHLQFISSWAAFEAVLETRFRGIQGYEKVVNGHWTLQDHATGRDISRKSCWEGAFLPGQRVDMSLLFERETTVNHFDSCSEGRRGSNGVTACPRCQADATGPGDRDIQCDNCGLCFRRITEIHETSPGPTPQRPNPWEKKPAFGKPSFQPTFGPAPPAKKRRQNTVDDFDVSSFKRIRIHSRLNTIRRHVFVSETRKSDVHSQAAAHAIFEPGRRHEVSSDLLSLLDQCRKVTGDEMGMESTDTHPQQGDGAERIPLSDSTLDVHLSYLPRKTIMPSTSPPNRICTWPSTSPRKTTTDNHVDKPVHAVSPSQSQCLLKSNSSINAARRSALYKEPLAECLWRHCTHDISALQHAVACSHELCAQIFLDAGADANAGDSWLFPLCDAVLQNDIGMVKLLVAYGADVYCPNLSPLETAVQCYEPEIFQLLLERGGEANSYTDTTIVRVKKSINGLTNGIWMFMRILQISSAVADLDANDFGHSGPYNDPPAARRDRDRMFSDVLSGSTMLDQFDCDFVGAAINELEPVADVEVLSKTRHDSRHENSEENLSGDDISSESDTTLGE